MNNPQPPAITRVLVIEDNPVDVRLLRYALAQTPSWPTELTVVADGEKALETLQASPLPDFVILDLNLPKLTGPEVLQWMRSHRPTGIIPVAVVSSSPMDQIRSKVTGARVEANGYFTKPMDVEGFVLLGKALADCYQSARSPLE